MLFRYEGFNEYGRPTTGKVDAPTYENAVEILRNDMQIFVSRMEEDGPSPMKTVFNHDSGRPADADPRPYSPDDYCERAMEPATEPRPGPKKAPGQVIHERPLPEGADDTVVIRRESDQQSNYASAVAAQGLANSPPGALFASEVAGISAAMRELDLLKQASMKKGYKGPAIGKKTWALLDKALPKVAENLLTEAMRDEAERQASAAWRARG